MGTTDFQIGGGGFFIKLNTNTPDFIIFNHGYIKEWIYHSQGLQYVRHWTLDLQVVIGFRKVKSCRRSIEKHCKSLKLGKI